MDSKVSLHSNRSSLVILALLGFVLAALGYLWAVVIPGAAESVPPGFGAFGYWDLESYFLPKYVFGSEELRRGLLPVWNRYEFGGIPFLAASQPGALYPPKALLFAWLEPASAYRAFLIFHSALLAVGGLLFLRARGIGPLGLAVGTIFWVFHAEAMIFASHPILISGMAWVPFIFLLGERLVRSPDLSAFAGLAAIVALQISTGYPEFVMDSGLIIALHAVVLRASGRVELAPWRSVPLLATAFVVGAAIAAIQVLPLLELAQVSGRFEFADQHAASPSTALPRVVTVGFPALVGFLLAGLWQRRPAPLIGFLVCVAMIFGGWRVLRLLPGFGAVRLPSIWIVLLPFYSMWLAAVGADRLEKDDATSIGTARVLLGVGAFCWALLCGVRWLWPSWGSTSPLLAPFLPVAAGPADPNALVSLPGLLGGLVLTAHAVGPTGIRGARALAFAGVAFVAFGHVGAYPFGEFPLRVATPESSLRSSQLIEVSSLRHGRVFSIEDLRGGFQMLDRVESVLGREGSLPPPRFAALERALGAFSQTSQVNWDAIMGRRGLFETLDVHHVLAPRSRTPGLERMGFRFTGRGSAPIFVFEKRAPLGRAWSVYGAEVVDDADAALERVMQRDFDPRRQVILEQAPRGSYPALSERKPGSARVRRHSPTVTDVEVEMSASGFLVLADSCFPGWHASVDGEEREILCANGLVRAVELAPGRHAVRFEYRPASIAIGSAVSGLASVVVLGVLVRGGWRRRRN